MKGQKRKPRERDDTGTAVLLIDPQALLDAAAAAKVAPVELKKKTGDIVFQQGDRANAVFFVKDGKVQLTVAPTKGRKPSSRCSGPVTFSAKGVSPVSGFA